MSCVLSIVKLTEVESKDSICLFSFKSKSIKFRNYNLAQRDVGFSHFWSAWPIQVQFGLFANFLDLSYS